MFKYFVQSSKTLIKFESSASFNFIKQTNFSSTTKMTAEEYEKEWTKLYEAKLKEKMDYLNKELSESEKKEVEFISDHVRKLSKDEMKYLTILLKIKETKLQGFSPFEYNSQHPSNMLKSTNLWPKENPNWFNTGNLQATINSFKGEQGIPVKAVTGLEGAKGGEAATKETKPKEEKPQEKAAYDMKLVSFDAAKKIALIKEIRGWLNLGLKEAKELVEKAPTDLKKAVKKEEAEELKKKLADSGAVVELI